MFATPFRLMLCTAPDLGKDAPERLGRELRAAVGVEEQPRRGTTPREGPAKRLGGQLRIEVVAERG